MEVGDLMLDVNGTSVPTDRPEHEIRATFARLRRPVTIGFYKLRKATEMAKRGLAVRAIAVKKNNAICSTRFVRFHVAVLLYCRLKSMKPAEGMGSQRYSRSTAVPRQISTERTRCNLTGS